MQVIEKTNLRILIADEGKHIRSKDDVYVPAHEENGEMIPEYFPHYSEVIFLGVQVNLNDIDNLYVEETLETTENSWGKTPNRRKITPLFNYELELEVA